MNVTVCQLHDEPDLLAHDWRQLIRHVDAAKSDLVVLPEMPFAPWFATTPAFDPTVWQAAVAAHDAWLVRLTELAPAIVLGSRPVDRDGCRYNEGFVWDAAAGYRPAHTKAYLPDEDGVWEASWYHRGAAEFVPVSLDGLRVGFAICSELWAMEHVQRYSTAGVHLVVTPRMTEQATLGKWLAGGRVAAIVAGAYGVSSNRVGRAGAYGGQGWIISPDGDVLGVTSHQQPFLTLALDLREAERAKATYPRSVFA